MPRKQVPIGSRQSYDPTSPRSLAVQKQLRITKLAIYTDIVNFYHQETTQKQFLRRWDELHTPAVVATGLDMRLKRAIAGKDAANKYVPTCHQSPITFFFMILSRSNYGLDQTEQP